MTKKIIFALAASALAVAAIGTATRPAKPAPLTSFTATIVGKYHVNSARGGLADRLHVYSVNIEDRRGE